MTNSYELAGPTRAGLIYEKQDLLADPQPGMLLPPHPMVPGTSDESYYRGEVTGAVPEQEAWVRERTGRPVDEVQRERREAQQAASIADLAGGGPR